MLQENHGGGAPATAVNAWRQRRLQERNPGSDDYYLGHRPHRWGLGNCISN